MSLDRRLPGVLGIGLVWLLTSGFDDHPVPQYAVSVAQVQSIRASDTAIALGPFAGGPQSVSCRTSDIVTPTGGSFAEYIHDALRDELILAGSTPANATALSGVLQNIDVSCGMSEGSWTITMQITTGNAAPVTITVNHKFEGAFIGLTVYDNALAAFVPAVQDLLDAILKLPALQAAPGAVPQVAQNVAQRTVTPAQSAPVAAAPQPASGSLYDAQAGAAPAGSGSLFASAQSGVASASPSVFAATQATAAPSPQQQPTAMTAPPQQTTMATAPSSDGSGISGRRLAIRVTQQCPDDPDPIGLVSEDFYSDCKQDELDNIKNWVAGGLKNVQVGDANSDLVLNVVLTQSVAATGSAGIISDFSTPTYKFTGTWQLTDAAGATLQSGTVHHEDTVDDNGTGIEQAFALKIAAAVMAALPTAGAVASPAAPPRFGIEMADLAPALAAGLGHPGLTGVQVFQCLAGSPADKAGISAGDIIYAFDGNPVANKEAMGAAVAAEPAGRAVSVKLLRGKQDLEVQVQF